MTDKLCPMTFTSVKASPFEFNCLEHKCAWWIARASYSARKGCAVKILALRMDIFVQKQNSLMKAMGKGP